MTSLLSAPETDTQTDARTGRTASRRPGPVRGWRPTGRVGPVAVVGGVAAAASTLVVCLAIGVVGWFLADAGAHGTPRDGLRIGALGWLMAHGAGVEVQGVRLSVVPLGLSLVCAWVVWRVGHRIGETVSGAGPDADAIADGERDWTVPVATCAFALGYAAVVVLTAQLAGSAATSPDTSRAVVWSLVMCATVGAAAVAVGAGRAAIWAAQVPAPLRAIGIAVRGLLLTWAGVSTLLFLISLVSHFGTAVNVMSQLHLDAGDSAIYSLLCATVVPNAGLLSSAYLLGPGFSVGAGTLVSTSGATLGPLPMFPLLAALPDSGVSSAWVPWLAVTPFLISAFVVARSQRRHPTLRWDEGAGRGVASGVLSGLVLGLLTVVSGGAAGPGRLRHVGAPTLEVMLHAVVAFGLGGLVAGLVVTAWQRRSARRLALADPH